MSRDVQTALVEYMLARRGRVITKPAIADATGLDQNQVRSGMYQVVRKQTIPVETVENGRVWRVGAEVAEDTDDGTTVAFHVVERLGGAFVLDDGAGGLWLAKRIGDTAGTGA